MHPGVEGRRHLEGQEGFYNALATRLRERGSAFVDISLFLGHAVVEGELEDPVDMQNPGRRSSIEGLLGVIDVEVNGVETWVKLDPASQPEA